MAFFSTAQDRSRAAVLAAAARARMNKDLANQDRQRLQAGLVNPFINSQMYNTAGIPNTVAQAPLVAPAVAGLPPRKPGAPAPAEVGLTAPSLLPTNIRGQTGVYPLRDNAPPGAQLPPINVRGQAGVYAVHGSAPLGAQLPPANTRGLMGVGSSQPPSSAAPSFESMGGPSVGATYGGIYGTAAPIVVGAAPAPEPSVPAPVDAGLALAQPQGPPTQVQQRAALPPHKHPTAPIVVGSPVALNRELNYAMFERNRVLQEAQISLSNGDMAGYDASRAKLQLMDATLYNLVGQKAVTRLESGDPRLLTQIYRQQTGQDYLWQRRSDGKLNLMLNGSIVREGLSVASVANKARSSFSQKHANEVRSARTELKGKIAMQLLKQRGAFNLAGLKAKAKITEAQLGAAKITSDGTNTYASFPDGRVFVGTSMPQELGGNTVDVMSWAPAFAAGGKAIQ